MIRQMIDRWYVRDDDRQVDKERDRHTDRWQIGKKER